MRVIHRIDGQHRLDVMLALRSPDEPCGPLTNEERIELFGSLVEASNWECSPVGDPVLRDESAAVKAGRHPALGEIWLAERVR